MNRVSLVMIIHDHQPVGNFDGVFRAAYDDAYGPFLGFLESHPEFRIALHTSGPLLEWIADHESQYLSRLRALVKRDQVEPWGGGLYEPILPAIPEADRHGQIRALADRLERDLGRRPRGLWLTERVWEPGLASSLARAGVAYMAVDDAHFVAAGLERESLWGHYATEDQGQRLSIFPIHRELRYSIPFGEPKDTKKTTLDQFVREAKKSAGKKLELVGRRSIETLNEMSAVFLPGDRLLASAGLVPVYYWFVRDLSAPEIARAREFLARFEEERGENRRLVTDAPTSKRIDSELLEYDNYNRSTNDEVSHNARIRILRRRFKSFLGARKPTR